MALGTERAAQQQLSNGTAGIKGFANDICSAAAGFAKRLTQRTGVAASRAAQTSRSATLTAIGATTSTFWRAVDATRRTGAAIALGAQNAAARVDPVGADTPRAFAPVRDWFARQAIVRFFSASLLRRILISNLMGFFILVGGILYLGWFHTWLIDAKLDALKTQGKIIADAIAANAKVVRERIIIDPNAIPDSQNNAPSNSNSNNFPFDGLAEFELSIHPEEVTPILRKLIQPTNTRARIYARDGTLIVDTSQTLARWATWRNEPRVSDREAPPTQNIWTRITRYLFREPIPVYQEIGTGNGMAYKEIQAALTGEEKNMLLLNRKGEQIVSFALPIRRFGEVQGVLLLSTRPGQIDKILKEERTVILILAAIALLASVVTSLLLARTVAGPIQRLSAAAERVSENIDARTELPQYAGRTDEVAQMAAAFQAMTGALCRRIEASEKFAADVAHELKNPLTAARSTAESLGYAKTEEERTHLVSQIQGELKRLNRLITDVSNASRLDAELARKEMRPIDVITMLRNVVNIFRDIIGDDTQSLALEVGNESFPGAFFVKGDEGRLGQVMTNLIDNAISFLPPHGTVTVKARTAAPFVEIVVEDEGPGIPEDRLDIIFDRFYSDRPATDTSRGKNSGLGLSISREIVLSHGGQIFAENRYAADAGPGSQPCGARFTVRLPMAASGQRGGTPVGRRN
ncbi:Sensor protein ChvG [Hyphomicrobium sp. 1Nfss2.1]|uniref:stimulus-sensing domain-containing protein n=1 Tax=Hyphomicrobium sp. 1Nfss2.1 TaxID=3413936 RepID=UPI003C7B0AAA